MRAKILLGGFSLLIFLLGLSLVFYFFPAHKSVVAADYWQPGQVSVDCWFAVPESRDVSCGHYFTAADNGKFTLPFIIIRDHSADHQPDPLIYLSGGPGSSSFLERDAVGQWFAWLDSAQLSRDLVVVDQRGTGLSRPQFRCADYENFVRRSLAKNLSLAQEYQALLATLSGCIQQFERRGFSFTQFSTLQSAKDLQGLMAQLNYADWNVLGVSYGSRLAMLWSRRENPAMRAMILDSVYPPGKGGLLEWPEKLQRGFEQVWRCDGPAPCSSARSLDTEKFHQALSYLQQNPLSVEVSLWHGGWPLTVVVNEHRFFSVAYSALYKASGVAKLSLTVDEIIAGKTLSLKRMVEQSVNSDLDPTFNPFTYFLVDCAENYRPSPREFEQARAQFPLFNDITALGLEYDACQLFPNQSNDSTVDDSSVNDNLPDQQSTLPDLRSTLFLSGELDPVTPARWVREVQDDYPNSQVWLMPNVSHGVNANSDCILSALRQFLDRPERAIANPCISEPR